MFAKLHQLIDVLGLDKTPIKNTSVMRISTDSRDIQVGDVFIALVGDNFDGHDYIQQAQGLGAVAVVVSRPVLVGIPSLMVLDTTEALGKIGAWARQYYNPIVFAITGSNGKTTVKNMLASILAQAGETLSTKGNLNNNLGVPMTLCNLRAHHKYCVVEMGANHVGEIKYLANLTKAVVATITNAGDAHIGEFGSLENLVDEKGEIYRALNTVDNSIAIIEANSPYQDQWQDTLNPGVKNLYYGQGTSLYMDNIKQYANHIECQLHTKEEQISIRLNLIGAHQINNALAAIACALSQNISLVSIQQGLIKVQPEQGRLNLHKAGNMIIIDDSYNANPASMRAAIKTLDNYQQHKVLVLGGMVELGDISQQAHLAVVEFAKKNQIKTIYGLGQLAKAYDIQCFDKTSELAQHLKQYHASSVILIKGSRVTKMEKLLPYLCNL